MINTSRVMTIEEFTRYSGFSKGKVADLLNSRDFPVMMQGTTQLINADMVCEWIISHYSCLNVA